MGFEKSYYDCQTARPFTLQIYLVDLQLDIHALYKSFLGLLVSYCLPHTEGDMSKLPNSRGNFIDLSALTISSISDS